MLIGFVNDVHERERLGGLGKTKTGPNDVSCIVWALGLFFFLFPLYDLILTNVLLDL